MSNNKKRLHPATTVIEALKVLKGLILPLAILIFANGFNINFDIRSEGFWAESFTFVIFLVVFIFLLLSSLLKWITFRYWFEEQELRIEYGLLIKKKRYIPFERIQNLNYEESIFHRLFGLVKVYVETASSNDGKAEAELTAITKTAADEIEQYMKQLKRKTPLVVDDMEQVSDGPKVETIYKMPFTTLLLLATTSNSMGLVLASIGALLSQFSQYIPYEVVFDEVAQLVRFGIVAIVILVTLALVFVWAIAVFLTAINYYDFTVAKEDDRIIITRGLFEKKRVAIPVHRIQAVRMTENPLRQLFGYAAVAVESAGGNFSGEADKKIILLPLIAKREVTALLTVILPSYQFTWQPEHVSPTTAKPFFSRINYVVLLPIIIACSIWLFPFGLLSILIVPINSWIGYCRYKASAYALYDSQLVIRYRHISRVTFFVHKNRIQMLEKRQTYFQKKRQVASAKVAVMSGVAGAKVQAYHLEEHAVESLMKWYITKK